MKPEEIHEELKPSSKDLIHAGPARPPMVDLDYKPLPNIIEIMRQTSIRLPNFHKTRPPIDSDS